jgi:hypothetical protein
MVLVVVVMVSLVGLRKVDSQARRKEILQKEPVSPVAGYKQCRNKPME